MVGTNDYIGPSKPDQIISIKLIKAYHSEFIEEYQKSSKEAFFKFLLIFQNYSFLSASIYQNIAQYILRKH